GGIVSRTITVTERMGTPVPRISEASGGIVWDTGLQNPGLDAFVAEELPRLGRGGGRGIVSIGGGALAGGARPSGALAGRPVGAAVARSVRGRVRGWLSGPALKPITLRAVYDVASELPDVPVIASGGIRSGEDAVECMLAGAAAVQVGTATLTDPTSAVSVAQGILRYLERHRMASPGALPGRIMPVLRSAATTSYPSDRL